MRKEKIPNLPEMGNLGATLSLNEDGEYDIVQEDIKQNTGLLKEVGAKLKERLHPREVMVIVISGAVISILSREFASFLRGTELYKSIFTKGKK